MGQWSDFVRGLLDAETNARMNDRLQSSPEDHRRVVALRRVAELAARDRESSPPDWAVRCAKAIGSLARPQDQAHPSLVRRLAMKLSFDSLCSPALAGTRDAQAHDRKLVFTSEGYRVDLRIEPEADFQTAVLVGQLMQTDGELAPVPDVPVLAIRSGEVVGQSKSGRFGEFQAESLPASGLQLSLLLDDELFLEIDLAHNGAEGNHPGESA